MGKTDSRIYLDYASSTPLDERVKKEMEPYWKRHFGNAGSIHQEGRQAKKIIQEAREKIADIIGVSPGEIIFTSGGTEANSLAIIGHLNFLDDKGGLEDAHIITTEIEHPSVLDIFKRFEQKGLSVDILKVGEDGIVDLRHLRKVLKPETKLVSVMYVNNEIGTIQPIRKISGIIKEKKSQALFHTDASQAPLFLNINPHSLGVDLMTIDAQKMYGPKGAGFLYKKDSADIAPIMIGGNQEMGLRPGTENTPLIVGLKSSLLYADKERENLYSKTKELQDYLVEEMEKRIPGYKLNGSRKERIPNNVNIIIPSHDSELLVIKLDQKGFACSTKSACLRDKTEGSYVVEALYGKPETGIRFTLGRETRKEDLDKLLTALEEIIK